MNQNANQPSSGNVGAAPETDAELQATLEQELLNGAGGQPAQAGTQAPAAKTEPNEEPASVSKRQAGAIRKQAEEAAARDRKVQELVEAGVNKRLAELNLGQAPKPAAAPEAELPDYLSGISAEDQTAWKESLQLNTRVAQNTEARVIAMARKMLDEALAPVRKDLTDTRDLTLRSTAALRQGVVGNFTNADTKVQAAKALDGWDDFLNAEDDSGMPRVNAYNYWVENDPQKAAAVLSRYADRFLTDNKKNQPVTGFAHMATPAQAAGAPSAVTEGVKKVSAAQIKSRIDAELRSPNPDKSKIQALRDIQNKHAQAGTLVP